MTGRTAPDVRCPVQQSYGVGMSTWFITGASRGLGASIARSALAAGHNVVATGRSLDRVREAFGDVDPERLLPLTLDVTDAAGVETSVQAAVDRFGSVDVVVNNAGRGMVGAVEEVSDQETRALMETNFFGVLTVTRAVLPFLRAQRSGHLVMISSYGGFTQPGGGFGVYGATKFAVEAVAEALRNELRDLGIVVTVVEPGSFRTDFLDAGAVTIAEREIDDYAAFMNPARDRIRTSGGTQPGDPAKAGAAIVEAVDAKLPVFRLPLGEDSLTAIENKLSQVSEDVRRVRAHGFVTEHD